MVCYNNLSSDKTSFGFINIGEKLEVIVMEQDLENRSLHES